MTLTALIYIIPRSNFSVLDLLESAKRKNKIRGFQWPFKRVKNQLHAMSEPTLSTDSMTGELHRRHHISDTGYYRGKKVVNVKVAN